MPVAHQCLYVQSHHDSVEPERGNFVQPLSPQHDPSAREEESMQAEEESMQAEEDEQ